MRASTALAGMRVSEVRFPRLGHNWKPEGQKLHTKRAVPSKQTGRPPEKKKKIGVLIAGARLLKSVEPSFSPTGVD